MLDKHKCIEYEVSALLLNEGEKLCFLIVYDNEYVENPNTKFGLNFFLEAVQSNVTENSIPICIN